MSQVIIGKVSTPLFQGVQQKKKKVFKKHEINQFVIFSFVSS